MGLLNKMWNRFHVDTFVKACKYGDESQCFIMLKSEPELAYVKDKKGISALFHAVANGHNRIAELILSITRQPNDIEPEKGFSPLLLAATSGHIGLVRILLEYGSDPDLRNFDGVTALHNAVFEKHYDIVAMLLDSGADPNIKDRLGNTAFHLAEISNDSRIIGLFDR